MGWRILYIENSESIKLYLDNLKIINSSVDSITLPLSDIHTIIIDNPKLIITAQLISKCCDYNINLIICNLMHMPNAIINPFSGNKQTPLIVRKQLQWCQEKKYLLHKFIIKNKIKNQKKVLEYFKLSKSVIEKLNQFELEVQNADATNREGLAAKMYFRELFGNNFKRFQEDVINAGLNYGYSILRSQISRSVIAKGLNPTFGIIHYGPENSFNLSDDIIEPFRPLVDVYCYKYLKDKKIFEKNNRIDLIKITTLTAFYKNKIQTIFNTINMFIDDIINFFDEIDYEMFEIKPNYEKV